MSDGDDEPEEQDADTPEEEATGEQSEATADEAPESVDEADETDTAGEEPDPDEPDEGTEPDGAAEGEAQDAEGKSDETDEDGADEDAADEETESGDGQDETDEPVDADEDTADDDTDGDTADEGAETAVDVTPETLHERLDEIEEDLEAAETEPDLDEAEAKLDDVEAKLEAAEIPEPEDDDEEDPREELEERVSDLRGELESQRGPYASDVIEEIEDARGTLTESEWTDDGEEEAAEAVETFLVAVEEPLGESFDAGETFPESYADALDEVAEAVGNAGLDADEDAETIAELREATGALSQGLDDAEEWDDLTVVEQLTVEGFYDRLESENRKDFPPELGVIRIAEQENDPERVLMALDYFESDFMQENCVNALRRMGAPEGYDAMMELAQRRDRPAIEVLGKIGNDEACETLHDYIDGESNPPLQKTVLKALGEIGSPESVQPVADRLVAEDHEVRSQAARALGRIGDTRAVDPLTDLLADDDSDNVRAAAAWALYQIGTEEALEAAVEYADDRSYVVANEAEKAGDALDTDAPTA